MTALWEEVNATTQRLAVPGGWVYRVVEGGSLAVFVPDPDAAHCVERARREASEAEEATRKALKAHMPFVITGGEPRIAPTSPVGPLAAQARDTSAVPAWRTDADADADTAVALLVQVGWTQAKHDDDGSETYIHANLIYSPCITVATIYRPGQEGCKIAEREDRTLTECARIIIRDAVERGEAPNMDAARAMVAEWDAAGGGA